MLTIIINIMLFTNTSVSNYSLKHYAAIIEQAKTFHNISKCGKYRVY